MRFGQVRAHRVTRWRPPPLLPVMSLRTVTASLAALALTLCVAAPAGARTYAELVAYGTGTTTCSILLYKQATIGNRFQEYNFRGTTDCSKPIEQTGRAFVPTSDPADVADGGLCSGFRNDC